MLRDTIQKMIQKEKFNPRILGFFINYNFLIRKSIFTSIQRNASQLSGSLLDFGCGTKPYKSLFNKVKEYKGIDFKIEGRKDNYSQVDQFYDGKTIPFPKATFDSVLCTEVLEHVFNIDEVLQEINRVLKLNGKVLITTPFMWEEHEMPYDFARYTTPALLFLYQKNGFKVIDNFKTGNYIEVIFQFSLNYIKNILPANKYIRQLFLFPFIFIFNFFGLVFSFLLPVDTTAYFNNVFLLEKIENIS